MIQDVHSNSAEGTCEDYDVELGENLGSTCEVACAPGTFETFDWAQADDDGEFLVRTSVCRCCNDDGPCQDAETLQSKWECWSRSEVWDLSTPLVPCEETEIDSLQACKTFCSDIDPVAYAYNAAGECTCAGVKICSGATKVANTATICSVVAAVAGLLFAFNL